MKKDKRIIILGDSMTYEKSHLNSFEENYNFLLKKYLRTKGHLDVFLLARAANHCKFQSKKLKILYDLKQFIIGTHINNTYFQSIPARLLYDFKQFEPNIITLHLGINDCLPRFLTKEEMIMINLKMVKFKNNKFLH